MFNGVELVYYVFIKFSNRIIPEINSIFSLTLISVKKVSDRQNEFPSSIIQDIPGGWVFLVTAIVSTFMWL